MMATLPTLPLVAGARGMLARVWQRAMAWILQPTVRWP